ncbi:MAG TPA: hypothetical protein VGO60_03980 [Iamia sp.]|jgi:hypothetical protein|nr:hypothetical protein [Iamia sp.]
MTARAHPVARATWEAAAARATWDPHSRLPCPGCTASVTGAKLADHVHRVHLAADGGMAGGRPVHRGRDRRFRRTVGWFVTLWVVVGAGLLAASPAPVADAAEALGDDATAAVAREHLAAVARSPFGVAVLAGLAILVVALLASRGRPRARVTVGDREVVLRHRCGTGTARVGLPARLESGSLVRRVGSGEGGGESGSVGGSIHDEVVGSYLRLVDGRRSITVGCPSGTRLRKHWDGWTPGGARRHWDVTLDPAEFVAYQYALAGRGLLVPRPV